MVKTRTGSSTPSSKEVALSVASCNLQLDLDLNKFDPTLHIMIEFLKSHPIHKPLTKSIEFPLSIIHKAYSTSIYNSQEDCIEFNINEDSTTKLSKVEFLNAIGLQESNEEKTFYEPTNEELFDVFDQMGYLPPRLEITRQFKKSKLPAMWQFLVHIILRCLTGKIGGIDTLNRPFLVLLFGIYTGKEVDFGTTIWKDFVSYVFPKKKEIPCARFWALALQREYTKLNISLPKGEEMFTVGTISKYLIPDQSEFGKVARLPEAMLQYIDENSEVLIKHREETVPLEPVDPTQSSQTIVLDVKKTNGLGTKRKSETILASQAKRQPIESSSQAGDVSPPCYQEEDVGVENTLEEQPEGIHSQINHEPIETSPKSTNQGDPQDSSSGTREESSRKKSKDEGPRGSPVEVRTPESESVRKIRDEEVRQIREQSEREENERIAHIDLNEKMLREKRLRDEQEEEDLRNVKAAENENERKKIKEVTNENMRKEDELNGEKIEAIMNNDEIREELTKKAVEKEQLANKQLEQVLSELREAEAKNDEEKNELERMLREEQRKKESANAMEEDFAFTAEEGLIQDYESPSIMETVKPSKSKVFLGSSETESEHDEVVPNGETTTLPTTTTGTSMPRRHTKQKKFKYISRVEFNSLNRKLSKVLEGVKKIHPSEEKFVSKEEFGEVQKIVTSLAQRVPSLETREKTLRESIVNSTTDALRDMEHKRTSDTVKHLDKMDEMLKMVKGIQHSYDDLTKTMGRQHQDEIVRISEQLCNYRIKNTILEAVLVKVMQSVHEMVRPCNIRFDEVLFAIKQFQYSVEALPKTLSSDELSEHVQHSFLEVFELIENLKGSFSSRKGGDVENMVVTESCKEPPPPPNITIPPTECEIHEPPPTLPTPPTSFIIPPAKMTPEFPEIIKTPIEEKQKMPVEVSERSMKKTFRVSENEKKQKVLEDEHQEEQHALTPWVYGIRQLKDDELVPKQTTAPPTSDEYQWDIPMSPYARYYPIFQPLHPNLSREIQMPIELARLDEFFKANAQPPNDVWSLRRIIRVMGYKKKSFHKKEYFGFEVVRSDNKKYYFSEADFPNLSPNDLYVIGKHFQNKLLTHEPSRFPFLQIQRFLKSLVHDLGSIDAERFDSFMDKPPGEINQDLEGIKDRHRGPTDDSELGIIFSNEKDSPKLFFRLKQKYLYTTKFLKQMIDLTLRSKKASTALKVKIIEEIEWWVSVRKWIKSVTNLVTKKI